MSTIWRPKRYLLLSKEQIQEKTKRDVNYEIAHLKLTADFKAGKLTQAEFKAAHTKQWRDYENWAKACGIYEEVTQEQQLAEAEDRLNEQVISANAIRAEFNKPLLEIKEKI